MNCINFGIAILFAICYSFQIAYLFIPYLKKPREHKPTVMHKIAVLVCARNEEEVIDDLFRGIAQQDYPAELIDIVLVADNCTDRTAERARALGARVYERFDQEKIGKGYALDYGLSHLCADLGEDYYDAFIVFDADNVPEKNFITEINKTFSDGYQVVTSYRSSKNYGDSWLSAGSGLWFLRESQCLNASRALIGACPQVSGTGFLFSNDVRKENGGWPYHTLAEDCEFTCDSVVKGKRFGYCPNAVFYDEQVVDFKGAWTQRIRWCKGGIQCFGKYRKALFKGLFSKNFLASYDMLMSLAPAYLLSMLASIVNVVGFLVLLISGEGFLTAIAPVAILIAAIYVFVTLHSIITTLTEWKRIKAKNSDKIKYMFTFAFYLMSFVPIAFVALFKKKVSWQSIKHKPAKRMIDK